MTLAISKADIDALAKDMHKAGIASFKIGFRGPEVVYREDADHAAVDALRTLLDALRMVQGRDGRRQFLELVEEAMKSLASAADKAPKPAPKKTKGTPPAAPTIH